MLAHVIPPAFRRSLTDTIQKRQSEFDCPDDVASFQGLYAEFADYEALIDRFVDVFCSSYEFVRMYHCCRPLSTDSYYKFGIRVLDMEFADC